MSLPRQRPISSAAQCEALQASLRIPHPEIMFGSKFLQITHRPRVLTSEFRVGDALSSNGMEEKNQAMQEFKRSTQKYYGKLHESLTAHGFLRSRPYLPEPRKG